MTMAPRKSTGKTAKKKFDDDDDYRKKRERNNEVLFLHKRKL